MTGEQILTTEDFKAQTWWVSQCLLTGCRTTTAGAGTRSRLQGVVTLKAGTAKLRFRWTALYSKQHRKARALMLVNQDHQTMPVISGVLLVGRNGDPLTHESQMKQAQAVMVQYRGDWEVRIKYIASLSL